MTERMAERPSWEEYFMKITRDVSERSTCVRRKVGAIIVKDKRILATGYNGVPSGIEHCTTRGCLREQLGIPSGQRQEICRGLHAEQNGIIQAALHGVPIGDSLMYSTTQPCVTCAKMIINAGIRRVIYEGDYPDELAMELLEEAGVYIGKYDPSGGAVKKKKGTGGKGIKGKRKKMNDE